jgi:hypothetical protein
LKTTRDLIAAYEKGRDFARAEAVARELLAVSRTKFGPRHADTASAAASVGLALLGQKKYTEAEPLLRGCLAIREAVQPESWSTFNARSQLGEALLGQKKYADAEPLLLAGYTGMKERAARIPADAKRRLVEAAERVVQLYAAWERPEQAKLWGMKLEEERLAEKKPKS